MPRVTVIPATIDPRTRLPEMTARKRRVAAYGRVSTDKDEQFTSYEAQITYYTEYIQRNPEWEFVKVYTDEGITGTSTKHREGFNTMIADALAGKIDLIITKSVSRFARNTVDSLTTIRKLKEHGTEVYFEKENIFTFDGKGELLLTIMSSMAQEESRSISENITWGHRRSFERGKVHIPYGQFLGYSKGKDGKPTINEEEAKVVEYIYRLFLNGQTSSGICKRLMEMDIPSPRGKKKWRRTTVESILTNEKYKGHARLQKSFTVDFLTKKTKANEGEVPMYYVEDSHPAIIEPDIWDFVQIEVTRRQGLGKAYSGKSTLSTKLICEDCGGFYGQKLWHSTDQYRRSVWRCNHKFEDGQNCRTPVLRTEIIQSVFIRAYNRLMENRDQVLADCELGRKTLVDFAALDGEIEQVNGEIKKLEEKVRALVNENACEAQSQDAYRQRRIELTERFGKLADRLRELTGERDFRKKQDSAIRLHMRMLKRSPQVLETWDDTIWTVMVEKAVVHRDGSITFHFYNGGIVTEMNDQYSKTTTGATIIVGGSFNTSRNIDWIAIGV